MGGGGRHGGGKVFVFSEIACTHRESFLKSASRKATEGEERAQQRERGGERSRERVGRKSRKTVGYREDGSQAQSGAPGHAGAEQYASADTP